MNKEIKLGIVYNEGEGPDFGTIQQHVLNPNNLYLLARDIPKLNGMLTRATSAAYLPEGQSFNFYTGALAYVVDYKTAGSGKIYMYHRGKDHWYEFNIRSDLGLCELMWNRHETILRKTKTISGTPPLTFESNGRPLKNYRIYGNTVNGESVGDLVTEGEHTGEYCVPVTITNGSDTQTTYIYLPEQLRKVGDEVEYIDFKEQKQHRVRKNLLQNTATSQTINGVTFIVNEDKSVTCNGTASNAASFCVELAPVLLSDKRYILNGCPNGGGDSSYRLQYSNWVDTAYNDIGSGKIIRAFDINEYPNTQITIRISSGYTCNNLTFYPMIRLASIDDDTYEPHISDTELDVEIPRLPTFHGTNTLSIETTVQPSNIENKGILKAIQEWSGQDEN